MQFKVHGYSYPQVWLHIPSIQHAYRIGRYATKRRRPIRTIASGKKCGNCSHIATLLSSTAVKRSEPIRLPRIFVCWKCNPLSSQNPVKSFRFWHRSVYKRDFSRSPKIQSGISIRLAWVTLVEGSIIAGAWVVNDCKSLSQNCDMDEFSWNKERLHSVRKKIIKGNGVNIWYHRDNAFHGGVIHKGIVFQGDIYTAHKK